MGTTAATQGVAANHRESDARHPFDPKPGREHSTPDGKHDEQTGGRRAAKRRRTPKENQSVGAIRYFLTKTTGNATPELDQEMPDEHQALITALKQDRNFVTVREWRARVDIKKGAPVIGKDSVVRE